MNAFLHRHRDKVLLVCALLVVFTIAVSHANKTLAPKGYIALFAILALVLLSLLFGDTFLRRWFAVIRFDWTLGHSVLLFVVGLVSVVGAIVVLFL